MVQMRCYGLAATLIPHLPQQGKVAESRVKLSLERQHKGGFSSIFHYPTLLLIDNKLSNLPQFAHDGIW